MRNSVSYILHKLTQLHSHIPLARFLWIQLQNLDHSFKTSKVFADNARPNNTTLVCINLYLCQTSQIFDFVIGPLHNFTPLSELVLELPVQSGVLIRLN